MSEFCKGCKERQDRIDELVKCQDENQRLRDVIERLGSMEAFTLSRAVGDSQADKELIARIDYAREALNDKITLSARDVA